MDISKNFEKRINLNSPAVETTPFVFNGGFYLLENWRKMWDHPINTENYPAGVKTRYLRADTARVREVQSGRIVSIPMVGTGFCSAFVDGGKVYVFGSRFTNDARWDSRQIWMCWSEDLVLWSHPVCVLDAGGEESFFNVNVCRSLDSGDYIMLVETDDPSWQKFTFKFMRSGNLTGWSPVPGGIYGKDKYVGGPAIYSINGFYYVCYLDRSEKGWITRLTRSECLVKWQDAPADRPFLVFNERNPCHPIRGGKVMESNASDAELCEFKGRTLIYFTGGDQRVCGALQLAEYPGTMRELFESFYRQQFRKLPPL